MDSTPGPSAPHAHVRKYRRFDLQFPVSLLCSAGEVARRIEGTSKNVSLGGLLINTREQLPLGTRVGLTMELSGRNTQRTIRLSAEGEVVRVEATPVDADYAIAVKCTGLISELKKQLQNSRKDQLQPGSESTLQVNSGSR